MKTKQKMSLHLRVIMQILVTISLFLNHYEVEGEQRLSKAEDLELEKQLKLLNKPAIKTIKGKYGEIYDCVDFYKQPAFDHPLLKNHNFHPQMKPTFFNLQRDDISSKMNRPFNIGLEGGGCPTGTVPIRRITKEDLIRRRLASQIRDADDSPDGDGIESNVSDGTKHPKGFGGGYKVSPPVYGDTHTRSYIYFKAGKLACYNTQCPGFVHINTAIPLDGELPGSSYGGPIYDLPMEIARDIPSGNWWFHLGIGSKFTPIGFWPAKIFTSLKGFATSAEFGGVVYSPPGVREPSMGSGYFPVGDLKKDAYCRKSTYFTDKRQSKSLDEISVKSFASSPNLYRVTDYPNAGGGNGNIVFYGGPGEHM
ncbi:protein neprosin-like isoform X2 [Lycium ferocissimum]|uniref:protein neprosin-like isoform X2 n=1 Tax=Lycium ferocissimum TaxID=112874 RepID=UPI0028167211|nr:protein neprosin-like isoform X2 [Lycium ferocissimum]